MILKRSFFILTATLFCILASQTNLIAQVLDSNSELTKVVDSYDVNQIKRLVESGADINFRDHDGMTMLMNAAAYGKVPKLKKLLKLGVDLDLENSGNQTALQIARDCGRRFICGILEKLKQVEDSPNLYEIGAIVGVNRSSSNGNLEELNKEVIKILIERAVFLNDMNYFSKVLSILNSLNFNQTQDILNEDLLSIINTHLTYPNSNDSNTYLKSILDKIKNKCLREVLKKALKNNYFSDMSIITQE